MYEVNGFAFESEAEAEAARKEAEGIKYLRAQTKMDDPDVVLQLYNSLIRRKYFSTPVGLAFLVELQEYLHTIPYVKNEEIWLIPIPKGREIKAKKAKPTRVAKSDRYKRPFKITLFFSIVLLGIVLGMFTISYYSKNNVNIINYENEIINKYESWEADLQAREKALREKEAALEAETE